MEVLPSIQGTGLRATLVRETINNKQIISTLIAYDGFGQALTCLRVLEVAAPSKNIEFEAIANGHYKCEQRLSERYGRVISIRLDMGTAPVQMRCGNFFYQSQYCFLIGKYLQEIDSQDFVDVAKSLPAMQEFSKIMAKEFNLTILEAY